MKKKSKQSENESQGWICLRDKEELLGRPHMGHERQEEKDIG